jgi:thiosulfate reductase cytochrome b subunit
MERKKRNLKFKLNHLNLKKQSQLLNKYLNKKLNKYIIKKQKHHKYLQIQKIQYLVVLFILLSGII